MHVSSISQNLRSGRWSTSALRQTWSQTASLQQLHQSRGQLWERCFDIVNITNPPRRLRKLSLHQLSIFPSAGGVGGNPCQQNEDKNELVFHQNARFIDIFTRLMFSFCTYYIWTRAIRYVFLQTSPIHLSKARQLVSEFTDKLTLRDLLGMDQSN